MADDVMKMADSAVNPLSAVEGVMSGVLGLIGQGIQNNFAREEADKQRQWNEQMLNQQNAWSLEQWNRTNEYNTPSEQRKRLEEAGLNPLFYGLDGSSANSFESAQPLGYERARLENIQNPIQAGLQSALVQAQIENVRANTAKVGEETTTEVTRREEMKMAIDKTRQEIQNLTANLELSDAQRLVIEQTLGLLEKEKEANIAYVESQTKLNDSQRNRIDSLLPAEIEIQKYKLDDFVKNWERIDAEIKKMSAETDILYEDLANYALNHYTNGIFGSGVSITNLVRAFIGLGNELAGNK